MLLLNNALNIPMLFMEPLVPLSLYMLIDLKVNPSKYMDQI